MSVEEYLEFEKDSPMKHEYVGGRVYAMTGVSRTHSRIAGNVFRKLADAAEGAPCRAHQSDMKVLVPDGPFYYPDVVVACGDAPEDEYYEDEPCLIVEVLSPNTAQIDRREKLSAYGRIPSLRAYLIVSRKERRIEHHFRDENNEWNAETIEEGSIPVPCPPDTRLSLVDIYRG